jgi:hypothetical protein
MDKKLFMIKKVEHYNIMYQTGALQTWDVYCEPFEYQGEHLNTGIPEVDAIEDDMSLNTSSHALLIDADTMLVDEDRFPLLISDVELDELNDFMSDTDELNTSSITLIDFSEDNPFSENI